MIMSTDQMFREDMMHVRLSMEAEEREAQAKLPHTCPCGALESGGVWTRPEALPLPPHSHGACPECVAKFRAERDALLSGVGKAFRKPPRRGFTGGFKLP